MGDSSLTSIIPVEMIIPEELMVDTMGTIDSPIGHVVETNPMIVVTTDHLVVWLENNYSLFDLFVD